MKRKLSKKCFHLTVREHTLSGHVKNCKSVPHFKRNRFHTEKSLRYFNKSSTDTNVIIKVHTHNNATYCNCDYNAHYMHAATVLC